MVAFWEEVNFLLEHCRCEAGVGSGVPRNLSAGGELTVVFQKKRLSFVEFFPA